jgi:hypothetical protein
LNQVPQGQEEFKPHLFHGENANEPKVLEGTWFALCNRKTWGNHVSLKELGVICPKKNLCFLGNFGLP